MRHIFAAAATVAMCSAGAFAQSTSQCSKGATAQCTKSAATAQACSASDSRAMAAKFKAMGVPAMEIHVGDAVTCCPMEAAELAEKNHTLPEFIVAGVSYTDQAKAGKAWAHQLSEFLDKSTRVSFVVGEECTDCPMSAEAMHEKTGKAIAYRVGNTTFTDPAEAIRASAAAYAMAHEVNYQYQIGDERTDCCASAGEAKAAGKKVAYVVGDQTCECPIQAECMLNLARIQAAMNAAEMVSKS